MVVSGSSGLIRVSQKDWTVVVLGRFQGKFPYLFNYLDAERMRWFLLNTPKTYRRIKLASRFEALEGPQAHRRVSSTPSKLDALVDKFSANTASARLRQHQQHTQLNYIAALIRAKNRSDPVFALQCYPTPFSLWIVVSEIAVQDVPHHETKALIEALISTIERVMLEYEPFDIARIEISEAELSH